MEIIKRKSGTRYREKIYLANGATLTKTFRRKTDAVTWKASQLADRIRGELGVTKSTPVPFSEVADLWLAEHVRVVCSVSTYEDYRGNVEAKLKPRFGRLNLSEVSLGHIERMRTEEVAKGRAAKTINRTLTICRQIFEFGIKRGFIKTNPMRSSLHLPEPQSQFNYFDENELRSLLVANKNEPIFAVIFFAAHTGMRLGEILGLCWDRINLSSKRIEITRKLKRRQLYESTKGKKVRYFPLNDLLAKLLDRIRAKQLNERFIFVNEKGDPFNDDHFCERFFKRACRRAGVRELRFHDLRHSFASHFMMKGGNVFELQKLLGHSCITHTMIYAHLSPDHLSEASRIVNFGVDSTFGSPYLAHDSERTETSNLISIS